MMRKAGLFQQLKALIRRNILLKARNTRRTVAEILVPIFWILVLALIKWLTVGKDNVDPIAEFPTEDLVPNCWLRPQSFCPQSLYVVAPNNSEHSAVLRRLHNLTGVPVRLFNSSSDAEKQYRSNGVPPSPTLPFGIVFGDSVYDYTLRTVYELRVDTSTLVGQLGQCREENMACPTDSYATNGLLFIQHFLDRALLEESGANMSSMYKYQKKMMPKPGYLPDSSFIRSIAPIYYAMVYSLCIQLLVISLVTEKQKKQKEVLKIMGMRDSAFWLSWILLYAVLVVVITSIATLLAGVTDFLRPPSNLFIFFLLLLFYGLSIINLAFVVTPFFDNPRVAGPVASLFVVLISLLFFVVSQTTTYGPNGEPHSTIPVAVEWLLCLLSPTALAIGIERSLYLDISGAGVTWQSIYDGDFPLVAPLVMLAVDVVLYFVLAVYLDNVMASEYGQRRHPLFCLMPSYWRCNPCPTSRQRDSAAYDPLNDPLQLDEGYNTINGSSTVNENVEPISSNLRQFNKLRILNISKSFATGKEVTQAVNEMSLDVYEGQITALLGHNGAGKTTLLNMLTGLASPTSGTATVYGLNVCNRNDMDDIRTMTGVCPQQNVLFELLTPREHLALYSDLKGLSPEAKAESITTLLSELGLTEQADTLARDMSGGQQRKLCVALALVGDPKLIFLDEPSAGLDPKARRGLWSLLKAKKEGRVVLLTTHFMDEADILADRKAIISKGTLQCCGSSLYLKTKFGVGYHLNLVAEPSTYRGDDVKQLIQLHVPNAAHDQTHGSTVSYVMPQSDVHRFSALFEALEQRPNHGVTQAETLGIRSYGISMTTLEEVFLKLESQMAKQQHSAPKQTVDLAHLAKPELVPAADVGRHKLKTLMWLRFMLIKRSKRATLARVVLPLVLMISSMLIVKYVVGTSSSTSSDVAPRLPLSPSSALGPVVRPMAVVNSTGNTLAMLVAALTNITGMSVEGMNADVNLLANTPHQYGVNVSNFKVLDGNRESLDAVLLYNDTILHSLPLSLNVMNNAMLRMLPGNLNKTISAASQPWPALVVVPSFNVGSFLFAMFIGSAMITMLGSFASETVKDRECKARSQLRISGATNALYWGSIFLVDFIQFFGAAVLVLVLIAAFQVPALVTGGAMLCIVIYFVLYTPLFLLYSYLYSYLFDKYETCQSTLPPIFSLLNFLPFVATSTLAVIQSTTDLADTLHYIFTAIDPLYTLSGLFFYITKLYFVASLMQQTSTPDIAMSEYFKWDNGIVVTFIPAAVWIPLLCILIVVADIRKNGGSVRDLCASTKLHRGFDTSAAESRPSSDAEDNDVAAERSTVDSLLLSPVQDHPVVANRLRKVFPKRTSSKEKTPAKAKVRVAVDSLTFHVAPGEVFGLLGPNGAGKSTVLNMLTAEVAPSSGLVTIGGKDIHSNVSQVYQVMGYCPQYDALWENLTLEEHLHVYAAMRGMTAAAVTRASDQFVTALCLEEHRNKEASKLSGGTKRKLSFAMSMIGTPQIVLMDEPSTGMDPQSKRVFWDAIAGSFIRGTERGAILTTHYMEEADALCSRIAIMVNGSLKCIGTSQHLKDRHGSGYMLDVKLHASGLDEVGAASDDQREQQHQASMKKLHDYLRMHFPTAAVVESFGDRVSYKISKEDVQQLSKSFAALEAARHIVDVSEYCFSQATLEQVFLGFAKQQIEDDHNEAAAAIDKDDYHDTDNARVNYVDANGVRGTNYRTIAA